MPVQNKPELKTESIVLWGFTIILIGIILFFQFNIEEGIIHAWVNTLSRFSLSNQRGLFLEESRDEASGEITALLFALCYFSILIKFFLRPVRLIIEPKTANQKILDKVYKLSNKISIPLHTIFSFFAMSFAILHFFQSNCLRNPFPELGLLFALFIAVNGLLAKWRVIPSEFRKKMYQFHKGWIGNGFFLVLIFIGHFIIDLH